MPNPNPNFPLQRTSKTTERRERNMEVIIAADLIAACHDSSLITKPTQTDLWRSHAHWKFQIYLIEAGFNFVRRSQLLLGFPVASRLYWFWPNQQKF
jgi:hypothetical protein